MSEIDSEKTDFEMDWIYAQYEEGISVAAIARELGKSEAYVYAHMKRKPEKYEDVKRIREENHGLRIRRIRGLADMIRADLEDTGMDWQDNGDGVIDFHSLRHTTASLPAASGVNPKTVQAIMRHSDINLTMSRYSHVFRGAESEAVESFPDFSSQGWQKQVATGTDGKPDELPKRAYKKPAKKSDFDGIQKDADATNWQSGTERKMLNSNTRKSLKSIPLGTKKEPMSSTDTGSESNGPGRIRTSDQWIMSPPRGKGNHNQDKNLQQNQKGAYKPAYKNNIDDSMPSELVDIIEVWADLPEHIKATIKTLVSVAVKKNDEVV